MGFELPGALPIFKETLFSTFFNFLVNCQSRDFLNLGWALEYRQAQLKTAALYARLSDAMRAVVLGDRRQVKMQRQVVRLGKIFHCMDMLGENVLLINGVYSLT